ncbi:hypothetical protein ACFRCQ_26485 [Cytobacillus firmus]|uniref:hypothetical protein n=1 Tax=Cytobacillus firmus TaxID=1399 RepID=UPI0036BFC7B4
MSLKKQWTINIIMILLAWSTIPFLGIRNVKRFLPASILIVILEGINVQFGKKYKWWFFYNNPKLYVSGELPFNIGPHLVGSMWILKLTFGNFKSFILLNAVIDFFFAFPILILMKKLKVAALDKLNNWQFFLYIFYKAPLLYGFQYLLEKEEKS